VLGAVHPRGVGLEEAAHRAQVKCPPASPALSLVIARSGLAAAPTAALGIPAGPYMDDHGVVVVLLHCLDHRRPVDTDHSAPYVGTEHAALLALSSNLRTVRKRRQEAASLASQQLTTPTDWSGEPLKLSCRKKSSEEIENRQALEGSCLAVPARR
jgi:hypothetical protein